MAIIDLTGFTTRYDEHNFYPGAHSRGYVSELSGRGKYSVAHGGQWYATFTVPGLCPVLGRAFRALVGQADGRAGTVLINPDNRLPMELIGGQWRTRKTRFTDETQFSDITNFTDNLSSFAGSITVAATASRDSQVDRITITLPIDIPATDLPGMIVGIGDLFGSENSYQAMECSSVVSVSGQDAMINIRPRLRRSIVAGDPVFIGSPPLRLRFIDDTPAANITFDRRGNMLPATFDMVEAD